MSNDNKALVALMDLVLAMVDVLEAPTATQRAKAAGRMATERRAVDVARQALRPRYTMEELLAQGRLQQPTRRQGLGAVVADGQEAKAAVEATVRRWEAYAEARREQGRHELKEAKKAWQQQALGKLNYVGQGPGEIRANPPLEADDSRVTDACCGVQYRCSRYENGACPADGHQCCGGKPDCGCRSVGG